MANGVALNMLVSNCRPSFMMTNNIADRTPQQHLLKFEPMQSLHYWNFFILLWFVTYCESAMMSLHRFPFQPMLFAKQHRDQGQSTRPAPTTIGTFV